MVKYEQTLHQGYTHLTIFSLENGNVYGILHNDISTARHNVVPMGNVFNRFGAWAPHSFTAFNMFVSAFHTQLDNDLGKFRKVAEQFDRKYRGLERLRNYTDITEWQDSFYPNYKAKAGAK